MVNMSRTAAALERFDAHRLDFLVAKTNHDAQLAITRDDAIARDDELRAELGVAFALDVREPGIAVAIDMLDRTSTSIDFVRSLVEVWRIETYVAGDRWLCHARPAARNGKTCGHDNRTGGIMFRGDLRCCADCGATKCASDSRAQRAALDASTLASDKRTTIDRRVDEVLGDVNATKKRKRGTR